MKKPNPLLILVYVAAAVAVIGYAYVVFGNRYGKKTTEDNSNKNQSSIIDDFSEFIGSQSNGNTNADMMENANGNQNQNQNGNSNTNGNSNVNAPSREEINSKDCDNDCARFKSNNENYKYCQQVCGDISPSKKESEEDCANLEGLEKDYCWRDLAVSKLNSSICGKISDKKLQSVCRNRVAEELLN